MKHVEKLV